MKLYRQNSNFVFFFWGGRCRKRADNEADIKEGSVEDDDDEKADDDREESAVAEVVKKWTGKTAKKKNLVASLGGALKHSMI